MVSLLCTLVMSFNHGTKRGIGMACLLLDAYGLIAMTVSSQWVWVWSSMTDSTIALQMYMQWTPYRLRVTRRLFNGLLVPGPCRASTGPKENSFSRTVPPCFQGQTDRIRGVAPSYGFSWCSCHQYWLRYPCMYPSFLTSPGTYSTIPTLLEAVPVNMVGLHYNWCQNGSIHSSTSHQFYSHQTYNKRWWSSD